MSDFKNVPIRSPTNSEFFPTCLINLLRGLKWRLACLSINSPSTRLFHTILECSGEIVSATAPGGVGWKRGRGRGGKTHFTHFLAKLLSQQISQSRLIATGINWNREMGKFSVGEFCWPFSSFRKECRKKGKSQRKWKWKGKRARKLTVL